MSVESAADVAGGLRVPGAEGDATLRASLAKLRDPAEFLRSAEGLEFLQRLESHLVPTAVADARRLGLNATWLHPHEIVHTALIKLCENRARLAVRIAQTAHDPWAYLGRSAAVWARELWGHRAEPLEFGKLEEPAIADLSCCDDTRGSDDLTPLREVVALAHGVLAPHTPPRLQAPLYSLLWWLAQNPPQRVSHESDDRAAAQRECPDFSLEQIIAVMNIAWGVRPRRRETSLLAALLTNSDFRASDSLSFARALPRYRQVMRSRLTQYAGLGNLAA